jgi:hypothetical protein
MMEQEVHSIVKKESERGNQRHSIHQKQKTGKKTQTSDVEHEKKSRKTTKITKLLFVAI